MEQQSEIDKLIINTRLAFQSDVEIVLQTKSKDNKTEVTLVSAKRIE